MTAFSSIYMDNAASHWSRPVERAVAVVHDICGESLRCECRLLEMPCLLTCK